MILGIICTLLSIYLLVVFVRALMTWFPRPTSPVGVRFERTISGLVDPLLRQLRAVIPTARLGEVSIDLSVLVLIIGLIILRSILCS